MKALTMYEGEGNKDALFAFVAAGVYGFDAFLKFKLWRAGQFVQGERTVQQSQSAAKNVI